MDRLIGVIGLGYIGLPLLVNIKKYYDVVGFDTNIERIEELRLGYDRTKELESGDLRLLESIKFTNDFSEVSKCDFIIITVPTPVNEDKTPDLRPIENVVNSIGPYIKDGALVVLESTVYPGVTEEYCGKILGELSNKKLNTDFFIGYSPERANPGDKEHRLNNTIKIVSASCKVALDRMVNVYQKICHGGLHIAPTIKVAESAKVIENIQRDLNIALINELAIFFNSEDINIRDVLEAASTKWNFIKFEPGFVGGHCIGIDPYYLLHLSKMRGRKISLIETAREVNDSMSNFCVQFVTNNIDKNISKICIMGVTFKEDCPDIRNSMILNIYNEFKKLNYDVIINDPVAKNDEVEKLFGCRLSDITEINSAEALVFLVPHSNYKELTESDIKNFTNKTLNSIIIDMKNVINPLILSDKLVRF